MKLTNIFFDLKFQQKYSQQRREIFFGIYFCNLKNNNSKFLYELIRLCVKVYRIKIKKPIYKVYRFNEFLFNFLAHFRM